MPEFDLKKLRLKSAKSQQCVANEAGISRQYYNYIERGIRIPPVKTAKKIAMVLDFSWQLFYETEEGKGA